MRPRKRSNRGSELAAVRTIKSRWKGIEIPANAIDPLTNMPRRNAQKPKRAKPKAPQPKQQNRISIAFTVLGMPRPKARARVTSEGTFTPDRTKRAEEAMRIQASPHAPDELLSGPVRLECRFFFPIYKSWPAQKKLDAASGVLEHVTKPDGDNLAKLVKDALKGVIWVDDCQVVKLMASKHYTPTQPRTEIRIETKGPAGW